MTGVVLCGGNSTRMGSDKGLLKEHGYTWAQIVAEKLSSIGLPVVVSVNKQQLPAYMGVFEKEALVVDREGFSVKGPLLGILSVHRQRPEEDLFVIACDIKDITKKLLQDLYQKAERVVYEAYVYSTEEKHQPLCAIYTASGLAKIYALLQSGGLEKFSMMYILHKLQVLYLPVKKEDHAAFNNYNSPAEI